VGAVRETPVSRHVAVTGAPTTAAPEASVITPDKLAETCAAENGPAKQTHSAAQIHRTEAAIRLVMDGVKNHNLDPQLPHPDTRATQSIFSSPNQ
jgi:hypothetical protein